MAMDYFLAGDIGGTKTLLQIFAAGNERSPLLQRTYASAEFSTLETMLELFLNEAGKPEINAACLALACPIQGRKAQLTNLPWQVDADFLEAHSGIACIELINDFEAVGLAISTLDDSRLIHLQQREALPDGARIVVGAGTGLGVAQLRWQGGSYVVQPSEGGHIDFAPQDEEQFALLHFLQRRHGHVSYERIVSGPGLLAIYEFLHDSKREIPSAQLLAAMQNGDGAATLARFAQQGEPIAVAALRLFVRIYGAFAGNIALVALPHGGVYIAGGIAAKIAGVMQAGEFMHSFCDKGRFSSLLASFPVSIVDDNQIGLIGASLRAQQQP